MKGNFFCQDENNNCGCDWDGGDCCHTYTFTEEYNGNPTCSACECIDPFAGNQKKSNISKHSIHSRHSNNKEVRMLRSRPQKHFLNLENEISDFPEFTKHPRHSTNEDRMSRSRPQHFAREKEMFSNNIYIRNHPMHYHTIPTHLYHFDWEDEILLNHQFTKKYMKRSRSKRNNTQHKANVRKTNVHELTQLKSNCEGKEGTTYQNSSIVCNHLASSVEGLIVILNPNEPEYKTDAVKSNFIGFKILVHSPYDFLYVEAVNNMLTKNVKYVFI